MTHEHQLFHCARNLPTTTTSALCCFAALVRRTRNPLPMTGMELVPFDLDSLTEDAPPAVVHVYQPQSSLQPDGSRRKKIRRGNSDELAEKSARNAGRDGKYELRRTRTLDLWDPSATAPCDHQHLHRQQWRSQRPLSLQLWEDMPSLPSFLETLVKRRAVPETATSSLLADRKPLRRQISVAEDTENETIGVANRLINGFNWNASDGSVEGDSKDNNGGSHGQINGKEGQLLPAIEQCGTDDCYVHAAKTYSKIIPVIIVTDWDNQCAMTNSVTTLANHASNIIALCGTPTSKDVAQTENEHCVIMNNLNNQKSLIPEKEVDSSSAIDDSVINSILQSVSHIEDAVVSASVDHMDGGDKIDSNFDIDELLLHLDVPIGESTTRDAAAVAALENSEAELARAEAPHLATMTASPETQQPQRLSDTGSEIANSEFRFIRAPASIQTVRPEKAKVVMTAPPLTTVVAIKPPQRQLSDKRTEFRKRLHRWRQSYAMDGKALSTIADWDDNHPAVLVSARLPQLPQSAQPTPPPQTPQPPSMQFRAIIFHPASLTSSATYLVDHFSGQGHPASSWTQLHADALVERRVSRRSRLAARLFGGSFIGRSCQQELLKSALLRCACEGHLPVVLLPSRPTVPQVGKAKSDADKFHRRLHWALQELQPLRLAAGLLVVFTGPACPKDAAYWASVTDGETLPTVLTVTMPGESPGFSEGCQAILTAARHCATVAALQRLL